MDAKILQEAEKLIQSGTEEFLLEIKKSRKDDWNKLKRVTLDFSIFSPFNFEYSELKYFERVLVEKIREFLVFNVFEGLFKLHRINTTLYETRKYVWASNTSLEKSVPLMFITDVDGTRKGYRFANHVDDDELQELVHHYQINKIEIIEFDTNLPYDRNDYISESLKQYERYVSLESFFEEYFSPEEYRLYINMTREAVKRANEIIGLRTVRTMSGQNLSKFKETILSEYASISYQYMYYDFSEKSSKPWDYISEYDYDILNDSFIKNKLYQAFCGKEDFAKSFVTSEYLFRTVGKKELFDYTSVICGYTKSIEQLLYRLLQINLTSSSNRKLWIKPSVAKDKIPPSVIAEKHPSYEGILIPFKKEYEQYFSNIMLSPMIDFLEHNWNGWKVSNTSKNYIIECLRDYARSCRNEHFHKDNIYDFKTVERIRNNTILVFYYLLGGYRLTNSHEKDILELGIESHSFDRLYNRFQEIPRGNYRFILQFNEKTINVVRLFDQELPQYDKNGSLNQSAIYFKLVEDFDETNFESACNNTDKDRLIVIDNNNMPQKVWRYDITKDEKHLVQWENE